MGLILHYMLKLRNFAKQATLPLVRIDIYYYSAILSSIICYSQVESCFTFSLIASLVVLIFSRNITGSEFHGWILCSNIKWLRSTVRSWLLWLMDLIMSGYRIIAIYKHEYGNNYRFDQWRVLVPRGSFMRTNQNSRCDLCDKRHKSHCRRFLQSTI